MTVKSHAITIDSVILYKFGSLISGAPDVADGVNSIDITPQVIEYNLYQSIFSPVITAELAIFDHIGLMVNFPLSGEEAIVIRYTNIGDSATTTLYMIIKSVSDINVDDRGRATAYKLTCVSIEQWANAKQTVQQSYQGTISQIVGQLFADHIEQRLRTVFPLYQPLPLFKVDNDVLAQTVVIPNLRPFPAISMLAKMAVSQLDDDATFLFYQTEQSFHFVTLQSLFRQGSRASNRLHAERLSYKYISDQIESPESQMNNDGRLVTNLVINNRLSSIQKLAAGYFHNNLFEINLAQKAVYGTPTYVEGATTIYPNMLNTQTYTQLAYVNDGDDQMSNRTRYILSAQRENDVQFPVSRYSVKWGRDLIATIAMSQVDLTITIPGTTQFSAGDLFFLEVPEMHGFNNVDSDDLISGLFLITEVKQLLTAGGYHTTVLRINKDSYLSSIDRESRYA